VGRPTAQRGQDPERGADDDADERRAQALTQQGFRGRGPQSWISIHFLSRRQLFFLQRRQRSSAHHWQKKQSLQLCFFGAAACGPGT
jgi:hypothetical protein